MYNGLLVVNKPQGFTSHDVVAKLRGILRQRRIGHAGTLDPMATGVLVILLGAATKAAEDATASDKAYIAGLRPGIVTDTRDIWGNISTECAKIVEKERLERVLEDFRGRVMQKPPMYSAVKIDGQRLYSLARKGIEIDTPAREIFVHRLEIAGRGEAHDFLLEIECSKGTYIRSLCHDIGERLGCGACMSSLERTSSGDFTLLEAVGFDEVEELHRAGELEARLAPVERVYRQFAALRLTEEGEARVKNGAFIWNRHVAEGTVPEREGERVRIYSPGGGLYMIGLSRLADGQMAIACHKTFALPD